MGLKALQAYLLYANDRGFVRTCPLFLYCTRSCVLVREQENYATRGGKYKHIISKEKSNNSTKLQT